jgi:sporulation protein YlmC with PRC-barrel domain
VNLVRDVLDKKLLDREDEEMGRVDGLVMQLGEKTQPRITHIEIGGTTLGARLHPMFERLARRMAKVWGPKRSEPVRIPWSRVKTAGREIKLDVEARDNDAVAWEIWIARNIIEHIPGGGKEEIDDADQH